jgi:phosphate transport system protein
MVGEHSSKQYDQELEGIRSKVLLMGGMVETQFDEALNCFRVSNAALADKVVADDQAVNQLEVQLDDACSHLIVRRQPAANDLRTVMATIKVITDLERVGDEASKIARTAKSLHERGIISFNHYDIVRTISRATGEMLHDALDAFARLDGKAALQIIAQDDEIDHEFRTIIRNMITFMMEDPRTISSALDTLWVAKAIERVGDHAKNIAEYVIYVVEGRDIRHSKTSGGGLAPTTSGHGEG